MQKLLRQRQLLVICGPTATGKTALALFLAKKFNGEILSADSRQVYRGMDIGTGRDLQKNFKFKISNLKLAGGEVGYYSVGSGRLWGYDLADPRRSFSVGQFSWFARKIIADILSRDKLPIVVGGTGLYIRAITDSIPTAFIPQNKSLREKLSGKSAPELFESLAQLDGARAASMNTSDRNNPRRLIRAIEVVQYVLDHAEVGKKRNPREKFDILFIGLTTNLTDLFKRIDNRVQARISAGFEGEVKKLIEVGVDPQSQAFASLGYGQWNEYLKGNIAKADAIKAWGDAEKAYVKRQMTWFKKDKRISWFNIGSADWRKKVENKARKWHNKQIQS